MYDREIIIDNLVADGMTYEEAEEFYSVNTSGAWMGENTPCFLVDMRKDEE